MRPASLLALLLTTRPIRIAAAQDLARYTPDAMDAELAGAKDARVAVLVHTRDGMRLLTNIHTPAIRPDACP